MYMIEIKDFYWDIPSTIWIKCVLDSGSLRPIERVEEWVHQSPSQRQTQVRLVVRPEFPVCDRYISFCTGTLTLMSYRRCFMYVEGKILYKKEINIKSSMNPQAGINPK